MKLLWSQVDGAWEAQGIQRRFTISVDENLQVWVGERSFGGDLAAARGYCQSLESKDDPQLPPRQPRKREVWGKPEVVDSWLRVLDVRKVSAGDGAAVGRRFVYWCSFSQPEDQQRCTSIDEWLAWVSQQQAICVSELVIAKQKPQLEIEAVTQSLQRQLLLLQRQLQQAKNARSDAQDQLATAQQCADAAIQQLQPTKKTLEDRSQQLVDATKELADVKYQLQKLENPHKQLVADLRAELDLSKQRLQQAAEAVTKATEAAARAEEDLRREVDRQDSAASLKHDLERVKRNAQAMLESKRKQIEQLELQLQLTDQRLLRMKRRYRRQLQQLRERLPGCPPVRIHVTGEQS